jgi:transcriptional regulator with XRE-family HTH domain
MSHPKFGKDIATFVRNYREEKGLTQKELGKILGTTPQYVCDIEKTAHAKNPVAFCARLLKVVDEPRKKYLTDLIMEMAIDAVSLRIGAASGKRKPRKPKRK